MIWAIIINELIQWFFLIPFLVLCTEHEDKIELLYQGILSFLKMYQQDRGKKPKEGQGEK